MTGMMIMVERDDGSAARIDITEATDTELQRFVESRRPDDNGWRWVVGLARFVRDNLVMLRDDCRKCRGTGFVGAGEPCPMCVDPADIGMDPKP